METSELQALKPGCLLSTTDNSWVLVHSNLDEDPYGGWIPGKLIFLFLEYNEKEDCIRVLSNQSTTTIGRVMFPSLCKVSS